MNAILAGMKRPEYDRALEGVLESKRILLPAHRKVEIERMLRFAAELKQPAILYGMREGYRSADVLKKVQHSGPGQPASGRRSRATPIRTTRIPIRTLENREKAPFISAGFEAGGREVRVLQRWHRSDRARLQRAVKKAIDSGLSREDAVRALTLSPAEIYGVADRLGSIEKGKIANLVVDSRRDCSTIARESKWFLSMA